MGVIFVVPEAYPTMIFDAVSNAAEISVHFNKLNLMSSESVLSLIEY